MDAVEGEFLDEFGGGVDLLGGAVVPAERGQEAHEGFGQVAFVYVLPYRLGAVAFGKFFLAVRALDGRQVGVFWLLPAESVEEQKVFGGTGEPFVGAEDVGDLH